jgi:two-component system OmpR family response regulator
LLEDDLVLGEGLRDFLRADGHVVDWCQQLSQAQTLAATEPFDAWLVDWQLPDGSGLQWLRLQRQRGATTPALMLTARDLVSDRIEGLDGGADDYLVKPFAMEELLARLRAVLRRAAGRASNALRAGDLLLDLRTRRLTRGGQPVELTPLEFRLLAYLLHHAGRAVHQTELTEHLYADEAERGDNAIEALVARLRRKIGVDAIRTRRGHGYVIGGEA